MRLRVGPVTTAVDDIDQEIHDWLHALLSVPLPHARFTEAFNSGQWEGRKRFYTTRGVFPSGLLSWVLEACASTGRTPTLEDLRRTPLPGPNALWLPPFALREYLVAHGVPDDGTVLRRGLLQRAAVNALVGQQVAGLPWPRGVLELPTGTGKTVAAFGDVVYKLPSIALMRAGVLADVHIYLCAVTEPNNLSWASWERAFEEGMVENERVNAMAGGATKRFLATRPPTYDHRSARPRLAPRISRLSSMHGFPNDDGVQDHPGRPAAPSEGTAALGSRHRSMRRVLPRGFPVRGMPNGRGRHRLGQPPVQVRGVRTCGSRTAHWRTVSKDDY